MGSIVSACLGGCVLSSGQCCYDMTRCFCCFSFMNRVERYAAWQMMMSCFTFTLATLAVVDLFGAYIITYYQWFILAMVGFVLSLPAAIFWVFYILNRSDYRGFQDKLQADIQMEQTSMLGNSHATMAQACAVPVSLWVRHVAVSSTQLVWAMSMTLFYYQLVVLTSALDRSFKNAYDTYNFPDQRSSMEIFTQTTYNVAEWTAARVQLITLAKWVMLSWIQTGWLITSCTYTLSSATRWYLGPVIKSSRD